MRHAGFTMHLEYCWQCNKAASVEAIAEYCWVLAWIQPYFIGIRMMFAIQHGQQLKQEAATDFYDKRQAVMLVCIE